MVKHAMHPETQAAAVGISFADLLRHNESEALKWRSWLEAQPLELLDVPFGNPAQRMGNVREMIGHIFLDVIAGNAAAFEEVFDLKLQGRRKSEIIQNGRPEQD